MILDGLALVDQKNHENSHPLIQTTGAIQLIDNL
jgi:hypothetical protein